eukprot:scaffold136959_cov99-Phaeocystis_antarctica.AAC.1
MHVDTRSEDNVSTLCPELLPEGLPPLAREARVPASGERERTGPRGHLPHHARVDCTEALRSVLHVDRWDA